MEVIRNGTHYDGTAVALGNFDGLHVAHMTIIRNCIDYANNNGLKSGILLFDENTKYLTQGEIKLITPNRLKLELLEQEQLDFAYMEKFDEDFMKKSPEEFIRYLVNKLHIKAVCVGYDYSFGYKAQGDVPLLKEYGQKYGFEVLVTDAVKIDGRIVASTYIRELVQSGRIQDAAHFLGRGYCIEGKVGEGKQNGRKMGVRTANVDYTDNMALPCDGVYAGVTYVRERAYKSVINIGKNPKFNARERTIESHILGFSGDIYDEYVRVCFLKRLRDTVKFDSVEKLLEQINKDIETVKNMEVEI